MHIFFKQGCFEIANTIIILVAVFGFFTLVTMVTLVLLGYYGVGNFKTTLLEKYVHVLAAATIVLCGVGMVFIGW